MNEHQLAYNVARITNLLSWRMWKAKAANWQTIRRIKANSENWPLEFVDSIEICDSEGLERILDLTRKHSSDEWGTVIRAYEDRSRAIVTEILDPQQAMLKDYIIDTGKAHVTWDRFLLMGDGYNGHHHFHPGWETNSPKDSSMFYIHAKDRAKCNLNWINLISFNHPLGPSVVGYNHQFTYINLSKCAARLDRVSSSDILNYLGLLAQKS